jgi:DUF917 family protein
MSESFEAFFEVLGNPLSEASANGRAQPESFPTTLPMNSSQKFQ